MPGIKEVIQSPEWEEATPTERSLFLQKFFDKKILPSDEWKTASDEEKRSFKIKFFNYAPPLNSAINTIGKEPGIKPLGFDAGIVPEAGSYIADILASPNAPEGPAYARFGPAMTTKEPLIPAQEKIEAGKARIPGMAARSVIEAVGDVIPTSIGQLIAYRSAEPILKASPFLADKLAQATGKVGEKMLTPEASLIMGTKSEEDAAKAAGSIAGGKIKEINAIQKILGKAPKEAEQLSRAALRITTNKTAEEVAKSGIFSDAKTVNQSTIDLLQENLEKIYKDKFAKQKRGVITDQAMAILAGEEKLTPEQLASWKPGTIVKPERAVAAKQLTDAGTNILIEKSARYAKALESGDNIETAKAYVDIVRGVDSYVTLQSNFNAVLSEYGRGLRAGGRKDLLRNLGLDPERQDYLNKYLNGRVKDMSVDDYKKLALDIVNFQGTREEFSRFIAKKFEASWMDKFAEFGAAAKLGPLSVFRSGVGNSLGALTWIGEKTISPAADFLRYAATEGRAPRERFFGEPLEAIYGAKDGWKDATKAALDELAKIFSGEEIASSGAKEGTYFGGAIQGVKGQIIRSPFNFMAAIDQFFNVFIQAGEKRALAYRKAAMEGLSGDTLGERIAELMKQPDFIVGKEGAKKLAEKAGQEFTYQTQLGEIAQKLNVVRKIPGLRIIQPFFKTPVNLLKFQGQRSPLGFLSPRNLVDFKKGGGSAADAAARIFLGSATAGTLAYLASEGRITGSPPKSKAEYEAKKKYGWQPYSLKVGDKYYSYVGMDPLSATMGAIADIVNTMIKGEEKMEGVDDTAMRIAMDIAKNITNGPYLRGMKGVIDFFSGDEALSERFIKDIATGFVPSELGMSARVMDPTIRNPSTIMEAIKARIPKLSESVLPKRDVYGQTQIRETRFSPITISTIKEDPTQQMLDSLGIKIGFPSKTIGDMHRKLTPEEQDKILADSGPQIKAALDKRAAAPSFAKLTKEERILEIEKIIKDEHKKVFDPLRVPVELRSLGIQLKQPLDPAKMEMLKLYIESFDANNIKDNILRKKKLEDVIGVENLAEPKTFLEKMGAR